MSPSSRTTGLRLQISHAPIQQPAVLFSKGATAGRSATRKIFLGSLLGILLVPSAFAASISVHQEGGGSLNVTSESHTTVNSVNGVQTGQTEESTSVQGFDQNGNQTMNQSSHTVTPATGTTQQSTTAQSTVQTSGAASSARITLLAQKALSRRQMRLNMRLNGTAVMGAFDASNILLKRMEMRKLLRMR